MARKRNGEAPPALKPVKNTEIARALGVCVSTIDVWRRKGMPNCSLQAAIEWAAVNRPKKGRPPVNGENGKFDGELYFEMMKFLHEPKA